MIAAEGEQKASRALREAAAVIAESPSALQVLVFLLNETNIQIVCCKYIAAQISADSKHDLCWAQFNNHFSHASQYYGSLWCNKKRGKYCRNLSLKNKCYFDWIFTLHTKEYSTKDLMLMCQIFCHTCVKGKPSLKKQQLKLFTLGSDPPTPFPPTVKKITIYFFFWN